MKVRLGLVILSAGVVAAAQAGTLSAYYEGLYGKQVQFELSGSKSLQTVQFKGTRNGGTDTLVPSIFPAYCVEIGQYTYLNQTNTHGEVLPLGGSTTTSGANFNAARTDAMERLWGTYFSTVNSDEKSAAFQMAVWEVAFDTDMSLLYPSGIMYGVDRDGSTAGIQLDTVSQKAQDMLTAVASGAANKRTKLLLLKDANAQDLITPVPEPATFLALGAGVAVLIRRRKRS